MTHVTTTPLRAVDEGAGSTERTYAAVMHLGIFTLVLGFPLPVLIPLIMWLIKRHDSPFIDDHGKEAINFHITLIIYIIASIPLILAFGLGLILLILVIPLLSLIAPILAAVAASRGEFYRYPACLRFVR